MPCWSRWYCPFRNACITKLSTSSKYVNCVISLEIVALSFYVKNRYSAYTVLSDCYQYDEININHHLYAGLEFREKIHKTAGLVAQNFYWTRKPFTRPESKWADFLLTLLLIDHLKPFKISTFKNAHWFCTHIVLYTHGFVHTWWYHLNSVGSKLYYHSNPFKWF